MTEPHYLTMETLQRLTPFYALPREKQNHYPIASFSTSSSPSASSFSDSQDDLLPDLWLEPSQNVNLVLQNMLLHLLHLVLLLPPHSASLNYHLAPPQNHLLHQFSRPDTVMLRDASLEYAQSLLPHSLLAPLTEENLDYNLTLGLDHAQPHNHVRPALHNHNSSHNGHHCTHGPKSRQGSVSSTSSSSKGKNINTQLYKTELCVSFIKMGVCPYGNKCQFAHGDHDLKRVERPANWRSKPCANWAKFGLCRYGKRCCFKHGD